MAVTHEKKLLKLQEQPEKPLPIQIEDTVKYQTIDTTKYLVLKDHHPMNQVLHPVEMKIALLNVSQDIYEKLVQVAYLSHPPL